MGPTDPNFWQIKIIILISHINIPFLTIYISSNMIFFFQITIKYKKIKNKKKISALDIVESQNKKMWSVTYVTCVDIIAQVSLTP